MKDCENYKVSEISPRVSDPLYHWGILSGITICLAAGGRQFQTENAFLRL